MRRSIALCLSIASFGCLASCTADREGQPCDVSQSRECGQLQEAGIEYCVIDAAGEESWTSCCVESIEDDGTCELCVAPWEDEDQAMAERCIW